mmetsp:Transcript_10140/g.18604  ORF Transcript_10140/g.18604 Transcript_10140/m.18604 type:complete len:101 (-) Transcript_10140:325-627(-)
MVILFRSERVSRLSFDPFGSMAVAEVVLAAVVVLAASNGERNESFTTSVGNAAAREPRRFEGANASANTENGNSAMAAVEASAECSESWRWTNNNNTTMQ